MSCLATCASENEWVSEWMRVYDIMKWNKKELVKWVASCVIPLKSTPNWTFDEWVFLLSLRMDWNSLKVGFKLIYVLFLGNWQFYQIKKVHTNKELSKPVEDWSFYAFQILQYENTNCSHQNVFNLLFWMSWKLRIL